MYMIFAGLIFVGLALVLLGIGFLGASVMKGGVVKDAVEQIGVVKGIGAGFLYGGAWFSSSVSSWALFQRSAFKAEPNKTL